MGGAPVSGIRALYKTDPSEPPPLPPREDAAQRSVYTLEEGRIRTPLPHPVLAP